MSKHLYTEELVGSTASPYISTGATSMEPKTGKEKIADLVKDALKEALEKKKTGSKESMPDKPHAEPVKTLSKHITELSEISFPVTTFKDEDWDEAVREFIPQRNPEYVIVRSHAETILRAWELNEKVLIYGPTGAGKSSLVEQLCALTGRPFVRINCTGDMDSSMIFGQLTAKDGSTIWVDGTVTEAVRKGAVFVWDEWDVTPPEISMGLQWLLEDEGKLFLKEMPGTSKEKFITPHEDFRLVAIGNTQGQGDDTGSHAGTNVQNTATLDRFGSALHIGYLPDSEEIKMIKNRFKKVVADSVIKNLVKLANLVRQGYTSSQLTLTMSPRTLFNICRKVSVGCSLVDAFDVVYCNKLGNTQQKVAKELYRKVFGS